MLTLCVVATLGAVAFFIAQPRGNHGWAPLALLLVTVSPTVFAYLLNFLFSLLPPSNLCWGSRIDSVDGEPQVITKAAGR